jgi:cell division protein ZapA
VAVLAALNLADDLSQSQESAGDVAARVGHARAASLRGLLDEVLEEERKTGS